MARRLASADGWVAPMMIVAGAGLILLMTQVAMHAQLPMLHLATHALTWLTWIIVGAIATFIGVAESVRNLSRYRFDGITRPRWWFEVARILWAVFLLGLLSLPLGFLSLDAMVIVLPISIAAFGLFFAVASVAYLLTFWQRKRFRGRAFECVNFFYTIVGGVCLVGYSASQWPPADPFVDGALIVITGTVGVSILLAGFISIIILQERHAGRAEIDRGNSGVS